MYYSLFFCLCSSDPRDLNVLTHSFPTRRSSDHPGFAGQAADRDLLADPNTLGVARIDEELGVELGWIGNDEQRAVACHVADIGVFLNDRSEEHTSELQ